MTYILVILLSYLIGSIPFSLIFAKLLKGVDVRRVGTGNVGATNTLVTAGKWAGFLAVMFDITKGFAAVILARILLGSDWSVVLAGVAAIAGHDFPVYLKFTGGKGISTTAGAIMAINPYVMLTALLLYLVFLVITRYLILSSLLALAAVPLLFFFFKDGLPFMVFGIMAFFIGLYAHRQDVERLLSGRELKLEASLKSVV